MIHATCHTADNVRFIEFDATPWFSEADAPSIIHLAQRGWASAAIADSLERRRQRLQQRIPAVPRPNFLRIVGVHGAVLGQYLPNHFGEVLDVAHMQVAKRRRLSYGDLSEIFFERVHRNFCFLQ